MSHGRPRFIQALLDLLSHERGHALFEVDDDGELRHVETVYTIRLGKHESLDHFHERLREIARPGDRIELLNNGGACDTARITRPAR